MKKIDPHVDIADLCKEFKISKKEFLEGKENAPVDLKKFEECELDFVGATLYYDESFVKTSFFDGVSDYYKFYQELLSKTEKIKEIKTKEDLESKREDQVGFFYSIEGLECLRTIEDFEYFYNLGVKVWGLTWSNNNNYASGRNSEQKDLGLTKLGKDLIKQMNKKNLIVDTAHLSEKSFLALEKNFDGKIINTHSNARKVHKSIHNLEDHEIQIIVDRGGLVCNFPVTEDVGATGTLEEYWKHIDYIASKWGIDYVGVCSDIFPLPEYPFVNNATDITFLNEVETFLLTKMSREEVQKVMHGNFMRVMNSFF